MTIPGVTDHDLLRVAELVATEGIKEHPSADLHIANFNQACATIASNHEGTVIGVYNAKTATKYAFKFCGLRFGHPAVQDHTGFLNEMITPKAAADLGLDYRMPVMANVKCYQGSYEPKQGVYPQREQLMDDMEFVTEHLAIRLFWMSCMIGSMMCNTRRMSDYRENTISPRMGGPAGCFIMNGLERHMVLPQHLRGNVPVVHITQRDRQYITKVVLQYRSLHEMKTRTTSTLNITADGTDKRNAPVIGVAIQFVATEPLTMAAIFILLGVEDRADMERLLLPHGAAHEHLQYQTLLEEILDATYPTLPDREALMIALGSSPKAKTNAKRIHIARGLLDKEFLPNVGTDYHNKAVTFGLLMRRLLLVYLGLAPENNRDCMLNVRCSTPVDIIPQFVKSLIQTQFLPVLTKDLSKSSQSGVNIIEHFVDCVPVNNNSITARLHTAFRQGLFSTNSEAASKTGLTASAMTINLHSTEGHLRKMRNPTKSEDKDPRARQTGGDAAHLKDMCDSTEGGTCGLVDPRANLTIVRAPYPSHYIRHVLQQQQAQFGSTDGSGTFVMLNGCPLWRTHEPKALVTHLRHLRRDFGAIPRDVSISWFGVRRNDPFGEVRIVSDPGEVLAPLFVVDNLYKLKDLLPRMPHMLPRDFVNELHAQGILEYVGIEENMCEPGTLTAQRISDAVVGKHTWSEIEPSITIMGPNSIFTPCADSNQGPRNNYHCLDENALVLRPNNTTTRMGDMEIGMDLVVFDEETRETFVSVVEHVEKHTKATTKKMCRIFTTSCSSLLLTHDHQVYAYPAGFEPDKAPLQPWQWYQASELKVGQYIGYVHILPYPKPPEGTNVNQDLPANSIWVQEFVTNTRVLSINLRENPVIVADITVAGTASCFFANGVAVHNSGQKRQAVGAPTPHTFHKSSGANYHLCYPQKPITCTRGARASSEMEYPCGQTFIMGIGKFNNRGIEDAVVLNKASVERGLGRILVKHTYRAVEVQTSLKKDFFGVPPPNCKNRRRQSYKHINPTTGAPAVGSFLDAGCVVIAKWTSHKSKRTSRAGDKNKPTNGKNKRTKKKARLSDLSATRSNENGVVESKEGADSDDSDSESELDPHEPYVCHDSSLVTKPHQGTVQVIDVITGLNEQGQRTLRVVVLQMRAPVVGDKFTSRHAQKGVAAVLVNQEDMPFTDSGMPLDICVNPCMMPSRMTAGAIKEVTAGKAGALEGRIMDLSSFSDLEPFESILMQHGFHWSGKEVVYDGITGCKMREPVAIGCIVMERLKHMVCDKVQARARGARIPVTNQPVEGRAKLGAIRTGEMERDTIIGHGAAYTLLDRLSNCSDGKAFMMCPTCRSLGCELRSPDQPKNEPTSYYCRTCENAVLSGALDRDEVEDIIVLNTTQTAYLLKIYLAGMQMDLQLLSSNKNTCVN
jgi:DNA-directed RNA polymerase beta subunit